MNCNKCGFHANENLKMIYYEKFKIDNEINIEYFTKEYDVIYYIEFYYSVTG